MQLSSEDLLKLNVMMAQKPQAVRIDDNKLQVFGLTSSGEARISLNPNDKSTPYLRRVREFLSGYVINSPGGFPVHISGWTRMGQIKEENLAQLLMLGEPEAVLAVVHAKSLTPEIAHSAWWCMPESENARRMLEKPVIVKSDMGPILAEHLFEHLAFETQAKETIESVRLMLQPGLLSKEQQTRLWQSSQHNHSIQVGFLQSSPEMLLHQQSHHADYKKAAKLLKDLNDNPYARNILWFLSADGQAFLDTAYTVLKNPKTQAVVVLLLTTIEEKFRGFMPLSMGRLATDIADIRNISTALMDVNTAEFAAADPSWQSVVELINTEECLIPLIISILWMQQISAALVTAILVRTSAEGSLMRRKLQPVTDPIFEKFDYLIKEG